MYLLNANCLVVIVTQSITCHKLYTIYTVNIFTFVNETILRAPFSLTIFINIFRRHTPGTRTPGQDTRYDQWIKCKI